jgi:hypothetical protein
MTDQFRPELFDDSDIISQLFSVDNNYIYFLNTRISISETHCKQHTK